MSKVKGVYKGKRKESSKDTRKTPATGITEAKGSISKKHVKFLKIKVYRKIRMG